MENACDIRANLKRMGMKICRKYNYENILNFKGTAATIQKWQMFNDD